MSAAHAVVVDLHCYVFFRLRERRSVLDKNGELVDLYLPKGCWDFIESLMSIGLDANYLTQICDQKRGDTEFDDFLGFVTQQMKRQQKRNLTDISNKRASDSANMEYRIWHRDVDEAVEAAQSFFKKSGPEAR